jgi:DNA-binding transcriptional LysR family regulator
MSSLLNQSSSLIAFVRVVESGSFSLAARNSGATPSSISKSIARLEAELGTALFRRSTRNLNLTSEGQAFYDRVAPLLRAIDDSGDAVRWAGAGRGGLRISMPSELGRLLLPAIHAQFFPSHPDLDLDVTLLDHHVDLVSEGYDIVLRVGTLNDSALKVRTLAQMDMVLVASPEYLRAHGSPESVDALRIMPFVRYQFAGRTSPITFQSGESFIPRGRIGVDSGFGLRAAALRGIGVAYLMRCSVQEDIAQGSLVEVLPDIPLAGVGLHALHPYTVVTPIRVKLFADFVQRQVRHFSTSPLGALKSIP